METSADKTRDGNQDYIEVARALRDKLDELISGASDPTMLQIIVDRRTCQYKVIVVGFVNHAQMPVIELYDSEVQQRTELKPSLGRIFGHAHHWNFNGGLWKAQDMGPCAYDCQEGRDYDFRDDREAGLGSVKTYALMKDRLFVLHRETQQKELACISEYYVPKGATSWVKVKTHSCFPSFVWPPHLPGLKRRIHACNGFLFVFFLMRENPDPNADPNGSWSVDGSTTWPHVSGVLFLRFLG